MFEKILIANRGEIACRIIKTAKKLGITSVIVYSDADQHSQAVKMADEAYYIGNSPSSESYLKGDRILQIAQQTGAQAIHPGYGFLSENAEFARSCENAGIVFIGPPASAIDTMGSKSAAKKAVEIYNVPVTPGYHGQDPHEQTLLSEACRIGFPVLIKATAGGGGKGMRAVYSEKDFSEALIGAKREALASFGDDTVLIEKYLVEPRHVEIQVFCDHHGNAVYLFERDCSIQRRHQKIIEEAPAPHLPAFIREAMGKAAVQAAKSVGYIGAGTIEFLLDQDEKFYFMEMNTRLQVEHPVTEMITQQDLVEWQLKVACKEPLPLTQEALQIHGHAIEVRVYAEDTDNQFLPSIGKLHCLRTPIENHYVRVDTGVTQGDTITSYYDPMMAKLIVWGENRESAIRRLQQSLEKYFVIGVKNNIAFLKRVIQLPDFQEGKLSTRFIEKHQNNLAAYPIDTNTISDYLALACLYKSSKSASSTDPWDQTDNWQMNLVSTQHFSFMPYSIEPNTNEKKQSIRLEYHSNTIQIYFEHQTRSSPQSAYLEEKPMNFEDRSAAYTQVYEQQTTENHGFIPREVGVRTRPRHPNVKTILHHQSSNDFIRANINDQHYEATIFEEANQIHLLTKKGIFSFTYYTPEETFEKGEHGQQQLTAPMPGVVVALHVKTGDIVKTGQHLVVLEAMKMEHTLCAPYSGKIKEIYFPVSAQVKEGDELMFIED